MMVEARRVEALERQIELLRNEMVAQGKQLAVVETLLKTISETMDRASGERGKISSELGAYGIQLTKNVGELSGIKDAIAELRPAVSSLQTDRAAVIAVGKTAAAASGPITKLIYLIGIGFIAVGSAIIGYLSK